MLLKFVLVSAKGKGLMPDSPLKHLVLHVFGKFWAPRSVLPDQYPCTCLSVLLMPVSHYKAITHSVTFPFLMPTQLD